MQKFAVVVLIFLTSTICHSAEPPIEGLYRHAGWCQENLGRGIVDVEKWTDCKVKPVNVLRIVKLSTDDYAISTEFDTFATTPSHCAFSAIFQRTGETLTLLAPYGQLSCKLTLSFKPGYFEFNDSNQSCRSDFCSGYNAGFDGMRFPRYDRPDHAPTMTEEGYCAGKVCKSHHHKASERMEEKQ
jgi:hypothetical protein